MMQISSKIQQNVSVSLQLVLFCLGLMCTACASRQTQVATPDEPSALREVVAIRFTGNTHFSARTLRKAMETMPRPLLPPWKRGGAYNPPTLDADLLRLKKLYFDEGFLDTTVRLADLNENAEKNTVHIEIAIDEGPPTLLTEVRLDGPLPPELPPSERLLEKLPLQPQQRLTKSNFNASQEILLQRLRDTGYARAQIVPRTEVDTQAHTAAVTLTLVPGELTSFGRITVSGAERVRERAIRRQLRVAEGERYNATKLTDSAEAIYALGMFQGVTPRALNLEEGDAPLDIDIAVQERKPRAFQFGFGFSTVESLRGQVQWLHRNILGGAEQLMLSAKASGIEQQFEARLHFPAVYTRRLSFTQTLFVRNEQELKFLNFGGSLFGVEEAQPAFDLFTYGAESRFGYQITDTLSSSAGLVISQNDFSNVDTATLSLLEQELAQDNLLFIQFAELVWRTSNSLLNPTKGFLLRGRIDHSNTSLLSDFSFVKLIVEGRYYRRLWDDVILAMRLEVGGIQPYGDSTDAPFNVRFFAGGPGSVRGFLLNRLGPLNSEDDPIGGLSLIEGSVEVRFPLFGNFGAALFVDFGNVFLDAFTYDLADLRYAVGPGIRYNTPIGPVRLDVGIIIDRRPGEDFGRIELSIGQAF